MSRISVESAGNPYSVTWSNLKMYTYPQNSKWDTIKNIKSFNIRNIPDKPYIILGSNVLKLYTQNQLIKIHNETGKDPDTGRRFNAIAPLKKKIYNTLMEALPYYYLESGLKVMKKGNMTHVKNSSWKNKTNFNENNFMSPIGLNIPRIPYIIVNDTAHGVYSLSELNRIFNKQRKKGISPKTRKEFTVVAPLPNYIMKMRNQMMRQSKKQKV